MQFLNDYFVFLDVLALAALIVLALAAAIQKKSMVMLIVAIVISFWAAMRFVNLI